jgi:hypothetical protein
MDPDGEPDEVSPWVAVLLLSTAGRGVLVSTGLADPVSGLDASPTVARMGWGGDMRTAALRDASA